jgi:hypothetical protein
MICFSIITPTSVLIFISAWVCTDWVSLGAFPKLRKAIISFVTSARPTIRMIELGSHRVDFHVILIVEYFWEKICRENSSFVTICQQ